MYIPHERNHTFLLFFSMSEIFCTLYIFIFNFILNLIFFFLISHGHSYIGFVLISYLCGKWETLHGRAIIYIVRGARLGVFYNLPRDAISIDDRSISRRAHAPEIAIAHIRMYEMRVCRHMCTARIHACTREEPQG